MGKDRVSFGGSEVSDVVRTRRTWTPNVVHAQLYSEVLDKKIPCHVTTYVLRWIDKVGGLDNYILQTPSRKLQSEFAEKLRDRILKKMNAPVKKKKSPSKPIKDESTLAIPSS